MRVQKRAARRRREARSVNIGGIWRFLGDIVDGGPGAGLGSAGGVVDVGGEDVEEPEDFSLFEIGEGEEAISTTGIHCFAIFFSTNTTRRIISKTIKPNAI